MCLEITLLQLPPHLPGSNELILWKASFYFFRTENSELHQIRDQCRREQQVVFRENEKLVRKMEYMERWEQIESFQL